MYGQKVIFLHHSTGDNLYTQGGVATWISDYNTNRGTNYQIDERAYPNDPYPWENYPYDYWNLWINNACDNTDSDIECLDMITQDYDLIIFKHCFPGAQIVSDDGNPSVSSNKKTLANYKLQYRALRSLMDAYPEKKFIVWTLVPLHRLATTPDNAARAKEFVNWVKTSWLAEDGYSHPNIYVFDFFGYAAENDPAPANGQQNCLKYEYEGSHESSDSHPNLLANQTIGPLFAQFIVSTIEASTNPEIPVSSINISSIGGATSLETGETLQFTTEVLPSDATNKVITWSVENVTGSGTITQGGLFTATGVGRVRVVASAQDESGVEESMEILIENNVNTGTEVSNLENLLIYPNPNNGVLFIQNKKDQITQIKIYSVRGDFLLNYIPETKTEQISLELENFKPGLYVVYIHEDNNISMVKMIVLE